MFLNKIFLNTSFWIVRRVLVFREKLKFKSYKLVSIAQSNYKYCYSSWMGC